MAMLKFTDEFWTALQGAMDAATQKGYSMVVVESRKTPDRFTWCPASFSVEPDYNVLAVVEPRVGQWNGSRHVSRQTVTMHF